MKSQKILRRLLFPHIAVIILLVPLAAMLLIRAFQSGSTESLAAIASYLVAFYTLSVWCLRLPRIVRALEKFRAENRWLQRWRSDVRLRVNLSLYASVLWNAAYAALQLGLGIRHHTFWFYSLAGYYLCLAVMRFFLVRHTRRYAPGQRMRAELVRYRACGIVFLLMNLALALIIFFMVYWNRTFIHHEITTIAMAAYTFTSLTLAIVNAVRYRRYRSPVYSASKAISLAAACVSMLTLESTMLTTFGSTMDAAARRILLGTSGGAISAFIIMMAIVMIVQGTRKIRLLSGSEGANHEKQ